MLPLEMGLVVAWEGLLAGPLAEGLAVLSVEDLAGLLARSLGRGSVVMLAQESVLLLAQESGRLLERRRVPESVRKKGRELEAWKVSRWALILSRILRSVSPKR